MKQPLKIGVVLGIIVACGIFLLATQDSSDVSAPAKTMAVEVDFGLDAIAITNAGVDDLSARTITAYLNDRPPNGYKAEFSGPAPGGRVEIPLTLFVDDDGNRMDPARHAIVEAWIGGGKYDYAKYVRP